MKPLSDSAGHVPHTDHEVTSISSEFAPSKCTRTSSTSEPVSTRSQTSSPTVEAQNSSGFAKPNTKITAKKARVLQNMSTTDKAVVDFCSQQWGSTVAEDSPRKLFVSSLMSDIESMTDQQFRQFRMKVLPLIDGILSETPPSEGSVTSARSPLQFESVHTQWPKTELHSDYEWESNKLVYTLTSHWEFRAVFCSDLIYYILFQSYKLSSLHAEMATTFSPWTAAEV